ncbi:sialate O-acetylesterase, partial [Oceaniglobus trochenteri]|uniref:sialate O-acetylesterase n=1 Tax=Oceaniglobus trochenteri TaxID=2763260 RepID=UPI001CFFE7DD
MPISKSLQAILEGSPVDPTYRPVASELRRKLEEIQLVASLSGLSYFVDEFDDLPGGTEGQLAVVLSDPDAAKSGVYLKGAAVWTKTSQLPEGFVDALGALAELATERAQRIQGDNLERAARQAADETLDGRIAVETGERRTADATLANLIAADGGLYLSTAAGLAATTDGQAFIVFEDGATDVYQNDAGVAVLQGSFASVNGLVAAGYKPRASEPVHDGLKMRIGGKWYSPDWIVQVGAGQSNRKGNNNATTGDLTGSGEVWAWNGTAWVEAALGAEPFNASAPTVNSIDFHQAHRISVATGRPVAMILHAVPGSGIATWLPSVPGANWTALDDKVGEALTAGSGILWGRDSVDLFGWSQGENEFDLAPLYTLSQDRYPDLITGAQGASWAGSDMVFVATEILDQASGGTAYRANEEWAKVVDSGKFPRVYLASSWGLTSTGMDVGQQVHFSGASLQELGHRSADIYLGKSAGVTSASVYRAADAAGQLVWKERPYTRLLSLSLDASDTYNQALTVTTPANGVGVVFEVDDVRTEVVSAGGNATLIHDSATPSNVVIWYPADAMRDQPPSFSSVAATGEGKIRAVVPNPLASLETLYLANHPVRGRMIAADLPRSLTTLRIQDAPGVIWTDFVAADLPPNLSLLNLNDSLVPADVQAAITAENAARGGAIDVQSLGVSAGFTPPQHFATITTLTAALGKGLVLPEGAPVTVGDSAKGSARVLIKDSTAPAISGFAPAGFRPAAGMARPENFGVVGANDTAALTSFESYRSAANERVIHVSTSGTGSGATAGSPADLSGAIRLVRALMLVSENTTFTLQLAAGTHTPATRQTLDDLEWSFGSNQLKILG